MARWKAWHSVQVCVFAADGEHIYYDYGHRPMCDVIELAEWGNVFGRRKHKSVVYLLEIEEVPDHDCATA